MALHMILVAALAQLAPLTAPRLDAAAACVALRADPRARDIRTVDGAMGACYEASLAAAQRSIPTSVVASLGYYETRWRPHLVGKAGELGSMQVCAKYYPKARVRPIEAALDALVASRSYATHLYGRVRGRGWKPALAVFNGGTNPNWTYADKVYGLARRVALRRGVRL